MSCIEAIRHKKTSGAAFMQLEAIKGELSCNRSEMCCLLTMSVRLHRQDFGTVALLVCAEYKGRVDTSDS